MKFQRIYQAVHFQPWLITPRAHASIRDLLEKKMLANALIELNSSMDKPSLDLFGNELPSMSIKNGVATIPIQGVIGQKLGILEKSCGAVGVEDVSNDIQSALSDNSVKIILLDISSPGGTVSGVPELANEIENATNYKKVIAFTDSETASAAYWIASSANLFFASPSADVGSIGVYLPWIDESLAYAMMGYKVDLIKNDGGTYKGMGFPGTSLTNDQRQQLQASVNNIFDMFKAHITDNRPMVKDSAMQGQTFLANEATSVGLIDGVKTRSEVMKFVSDYSKSK
jgi:signal peptide peptidase SppA